MKFDPDDPSSLICPQDGTYSEEWKYLCLVMHISDAIAREPDLHRRKIIAASWVKKHGDQSWQKMRQDIISYREITSHM